MSGNGRGPAIVVLTAGAAEVARRIVGTLPGAELQGRRGRVASADLFFEETTAHLRALFEAERPIIGLCAAGILIRALAPLLADKRGEPPVIAVAEDGSAVVPLLGGHRGANELARTIADALGVRAAITTAGDLRFGVALDAPPPGLRLANPQQAKDFMARLLAGERVKLEGEAPWLSNSALPFAEDARLTLRATCDSDEGAPDRLVYHPQRLALGVGCARGCAAEELQALVRETLAKAQLSPLAVAGVYSLDLKSDETAVQALAATLEVPARFFETEALKKEMPRLATPSEVVEREVGVPGVAEAAALAAAGPESALLVPKRKSANATCAVALAAAPFDGAAVGRPRGTLAVVGLGPGDEAWRTAEAEAALANADELVGYKLYLDLIGPLATGKRLHAFALGDEEARVTFALDLAAQGRRVALVCSGDPGIYAMASLVFEALERGGRTDWKRVAIAVVPGISALQAAAARSGAPLGHDFCAISLSDLLTPWPQIERRLAAAAEGDFVVALYNPVSQRRRWQLEQATQILLKHRPPETPVVLARNLGRAGEAVHVLPLSELSVDAVDMLTVVLVGSSTTRRLERGEGGAWVYTPRGYGDKAKSSSEDAA